MPGVVELVTKLSESQDAGDLSIIILLLLADAEEVSKCMSFADFVQAIQEDSSTLLVLGLAEHLDLSSVIGFVSYVHVIKSSL